MISDLKTAGTPRRLILSLLLAIALLALGTPLVKMLVMRGGIAGYAAPMALTFCNVLLVGNLAAALLSFLVFGPSRLWHALRDCGPGEWGWMLASGCLAVLVPGFLYAALETVAVTETVLISRLGLVLQGLLAFAIWRKRIMRNEVLGYLLILMGALFVMWTGEDFMLSKGLWFLLLATGFHALAIISARQTLNRISLGLFLCVRNLFSALFFFGVGSFLFGIDHFAHAFAAPLWGLMVLYAILVILIGQGLWLHYAAQSPPTLQRRLKYVEPIFTLGYAFLLLDEIPDVWELLAILLIMGGMAVVHLHPFAYLHPLQSSPNATGR